MAFLRPLVALFLLSLLQVRFSSPTTIASKQYGAPCSTVQECHSGLGTITCSLEKYICTCVNPDSMVYNQRDNLCQSRIGGQCYTAPLKNGHVRNCVAGAKCIPITTIGTNMGTCIEDIPEDSLEEEETMKDNEVKKVVEADEEDVVDEDESENMESTPFDEETTTPLPGALVGQGCLQDSNCQVRVPNSFCDQFICRCQVGHTTENGDMSQCKKKVGTACNAKGDCVRNATCNDSCQCNSSYVVKGGGTCGLIINEQCFVKDDCLDNADCELDGLSPDKKCTCDAGLAPSADLTKCSGTSASLHAIVLGIVLMILLVNKV